MSIKLGIPSVEVQTKPRITVFGVGGAGGNAVNNMIRSALEGVEFVVANTDAQALQGNLASKRVQLGSTITRGLGAGSRPDVGRAAAEEQLEEILGHLSGTNMCFITAGMGGGTGTGAAPVIARAAREQGILTVGVVTKPFNFEGAHRMRTAESGIAELAQYVDTLLIIPNQNLFRIANEKTTFADAFKMADDVLHAGVRGVTDLMVMPGLINLDFADIRTVMSEMGKAMMGTGESDSDRRAIDAAEAAINNPLLDDISMKGARGVLINITGGHDMTLFEVDEAANRIRDEVDPEANIIFGSTFDESMSGKMRVSVVATGIDNAVQQRPPVGQPQLQVVSGRRVAPTPAAAPASAVASIPAVPSNPIPVRPALQPAAIPGAAAPAFAPMTPAPMPGATLAEAPAAATAMGEEQPAIEAQATAAMAVATAPMVSAPTSHELRPSDMRPAAPARRDDAFIPPRAAEGAPRATQPTAPERFVPPAPQPEKRGFFNKLFGGGSPQPAPAAPRMPAPAPQSPAPQFHAQARQAAPAPQPVVQPEPAPRPKATPSDEEMLDIPAFLRRQAN
ncbi:cell division protein FtsZ [Niveispirillum lacus]|uniref:Cell division protein FtsZ n=1 Tax=Niveispirillum lacus TaxID=1981099 RepID=A0A255YVE0_9PROT|nr:cell division protein FtsZ [Niveispirillum lacus]OYQ32390.1 cell division protein FtsZ [Niveispirillum lacus]